MHFNLCLTLFNKNLNMNLNTHRFGILKLDLVSSIGLLSGVPLLPLDLHPSIRVWV